MKLTVRVPLIHSLNLAGFLLCLVLPLALGHGRLREPPSRSSMWRDGFPNPPNYSDNELNCGGFANQWQSQGGKCGVCGDPWQSKQPRQNEAGGKYANGIIVRRYKEDATIDVKVQITAAHKGWYEFRLCENEDHSVPITHDCLDKHLLEIQGHGTRYFLKSTGPTWSNLTVKLPPGVTCKNCVLQWKWHCGNSWGTDRNGTSCIGCGPQEEFYGCSDVAILPGSGKMPPVTTTTSAEKTTVNLNRNVTKSEMIPEITTGAMAATTTEGVTLNTAKPKVTKGSEVMSTTQHIASTRTDLGVTTGSEVRSTKQPIAPTPKPEVASKPSCRARRWFQSINGDAWCVANCNAGYCPSSHCICGSATEPEDCKPTGAFRQVTGSAFWCASNCAQGYCPKTHCVCAD